MAVSYIEFNVSPGATSTSCVIAKPINLAIGNLMVAHVSSASTTAITAPDVTWTQLRNIAATNGRGATFYKIATSTDVAATNFTFTCGNANNKGAISTYSGHDRGTPIATSNGQANGVTTTVTTPGITRKAAESPRSELFASVFNRGMNAVNLPFLYTLYTNSTTIQVLQKILENK